MLHTTFNLSKLAGACGQRDGSGEGYDKLAIALGGVTQYGKNTPIPLARIVESNGLGDALWCLRAVLPEENAARDNLARLFACDCAEHVASIYTAFKSDGWLPKDTIEVVRRYVRREATLEELDAARAAARAAARDVAGAAGDAGDAAWAAAWAAAGAAAGAAARAARDAAWAAAGAARDAARDVAGAAGAAWYAARDAAGAAWAAAGDTALAAERAWQTERFLALLNEETIVAAEGRSA